VIAVKKILRRFGGLDLPTHLPDDTKKLAHYDRESANFDVRLRAIEASIDAQARRRLEYDKGG
jgi:hypothetical protein